METPLLPQAAVAVELNLSPRTLERWRLTGEGPRYVKCGRAIRYRREDVAEWLRTREATSTSNAPGRFS